VVGSWGNIDRDPGWRPEIGLEQSWWYAFADWIDRLPIE
jgi:hypothetical protein